VPLIFAHLSSSQNANSKRIQESGVRIMKEAACVCVDGGTSYSEKFLVREGKAE